MVTITLKREGSHPEHRFSLEGEPPASILPHAECIGWNVAVEDISSIPAKFAKAKLASGRLLKEVTGYVTIAVGTESDEGQVSFGQHHPVPCHGVLKLPPGQLDDLDIPDDELRVSIYVSKSIFDRLLGILQAGYVPSLTLHLSEAPGLKCSIVNGRLDEWDNVTSPNVFIEWCDFRVTFNEPRRRVIY
jgi:hypothetical protein